MAERLLHPSFCECLLPLDVLGGAILLQLLLGVLNGGLGCLAARTPSMDRALLGCGPSYREVV